MNIFKATVRDVLSEGILSRNLRSSSRWHRILHQKFQSVIIVKTSKKIVLKTTLCNVLSEGISSRNLRSSSRWRRCLRRVEENGDSASGYAKIHRSKNQNSPIKQNYSPGASLVNIVNTIFTFEGFPISSFLPPRRIDFSPISQVGRFSPLGSLFFAKLVR